MKLTLHRDSHRILHRILQGTHRWLHLLVVVVLTLLPTVAFAAPSAQADDPQEMNLGQFVRAELAKDEVVTYRLSLEGGGTYTLIVVNEDGKKIDFAVTDVAGNEIASGELADTELELEPNEYLFTFTAARKAELGVVVVGDYGELSNDYNEPGQLYSGSFIEVQDVEETLYATVNIPEFDFYQFVLVSIQGGADDDYSFDVSGDGVYESSTLSDGGQVQFWSKGGEYEFSVSLSTGGASLTVMVLLSGSVPGIEVGEEVTAELSSEGDTTYRSFDVREPGTLVTVSIEAADEDADFDLAVGLNPQTESWSSYTYGPSDSLQFMAPYAGTYTVKVESSTGKGEFTLLVEEGDLAPELVVNQRIWGSVASGSPIVYRMQVDEPGNLLSIILAGSQASDLDLVVSLLNEAGETIHYESGYITGSSEIISISAAEAGLYEVRVNNSTYDEGASAGFALISRLENPADFAGQWASAATASSQYQEENYTAGQATGAPNTPLPGDFGTAWASLEADAGEETLELTYEVAVVPSAVNIYETYNPGAVVLVEAYDGEDWVTLWEGSETTDEIARVFSPELEEVDFATNQIRLTLDSESVIGWNEIDAVELVGLPE